MGHPKPGYQYGHGVPMSCSGASGYGVTSHFQNSWPQVTLLAVVRTPVIGAEQNPET